MNSPAERFWSTAAVRAPHRFAFWNDAVSNAVLNVDVDRTVRGEFDGWISARARGSACFSLFSSAPHRILRTSRHIARNLEESYLVSLQIEGTALMEQRGRQLVLEPGDIGIINGEIPFSVNFPGNVRRVVAVLPRALLPAQRKDLAIRLPKLPSGHGLSALVRAHMIKLASTDADLTLAQAHVLVNNVCSLLSIATPDESSGVTAEVITAWIRSNLGERSLSPSKAAAAFCISLRSVHGAMAKAGTSFSAVVLQERLSACAEALEAFPKKSVAEIAYLYGFTAAAHFHRTFRARFGVTPKELQGQKLESNTKSKALHGQS
jgi:AraC-like DNA-binding protein